MSETSQGQVISRMIHRGRGLPIPPGVLARDGIIPRLPSGTNSSARDSLGRGRPNLPSASRSLHFSSPSNERPTLTRPEIAQHGLTQRITEQQTRPTGMVHNVPNGLIRDSSPSNERTPLTRPEIAPHGLTSRTTAQQTHPSGMVQTPNGQTHADITPPSPNIPHLSIPSRPQTRSQHSSLQANVEPRNQSEDHLNAEHENGVENANPKKRKGRGCNLDVDYPANNPEDRIWIVPTPRGDWPLGSKVQRTIGYHIRNKLEEAFPTWSSVPEDAKIRLWSIFTSTYQWAAEYNRVIQNRWNEGMSSSFRQATFGARLKLKKGENVSWLADDQQEKLVEYWDADAFKKQSASGTKNRNSLNSGTHSGGSISMEHHQIKKQMDWSQVYEDTHMTKEKKIVSGEQFVTLPRKWLNQHFEDISNKYAEECTKEFGEREAWPKDVYPQGWLNAAEPKKYKIPGVPSYTNPSKLGFPSRKRSNIFDRENSDSGKENSELHVLRNKLSTLNDQVAALMDALTAAQIPFHLRSPVVTSSSATGLARPHTVGNNNEGGSGANNGGADCTEAGGDDFNLDLALEEGMDGWSTYLRDNVEQHD